VPFNYLQASTFNLDGFFSLIGGIISYIFSVSFLTFMYVLGTLLAIALITLVLFLLVRMYEISQADKKAQKPVASPAVMPSSTVAPGAAFTASDAVVAKQNETWKGIRERLLSDNNSDWKLAIIEADIYLDRVLDDQGFHGDTTGDKLKQVTPDKLPSVQIAWAAHMVRNRIAHDGAAFVLTMPEARRMLSYFEIVFTDLGVI
jgi:hypothetical protein